jgi:hypothetical protein
VPLKAKPLKVLNHGGYELRLGTAAVEIFVPKDKGATVGLCALLGNPESAGMSQVQEPGG